VTQDNGTRRVNPKKPLVDIDEIVHELEAIDRQRRGRKKGAFLFGSVAAVALLVAGSGAIIVSGSGGGKSLANGKDLGTQTSAVVKAPNADTNTDVTSADANPPQSPLTGAPVTGGAAGTSTALSPNTDVTSRTSATFSIGADVPNADVSAGALGNGGLNSGSSSGSATFSIGADAGINNGSGGSNNGNGGNGGNGGGGNGGNGGGGNGGGGGGDDGGNDDGSTAGNDPLLSLNVGGNTVSVGGDDGLIGVDLNDDGLLDGVTGDDGLLDGVTGDDGLLDGVTGDDGLLDGVTGDDGLLGGGGLLGLGLGSSNGGLLDINAGDTGVNLGNEGLELEGSPETEELIEIDLGGLF